MSPTEQILSSPGVVYLLGTRCDEYRASSTQGIWLAGLQLHVALKPPCGCDAGPGVIWKLLGAYGGSTAEGERERKGMFLPQTPCVAWNICGARKMKLTVFAQVEENGGGETLLWVQCFFF